MRHDYYDIDKEQLPFRFEFDSEQESFFMDIDYNKSHDFFTASLYDAQMNPLVVGEKLVLNIPLFSEINDARLPAERFVPLDESGQAKRVTWNNFNETVFLCIDDLPADTEAGPSEEDMAMGSDPNAE